MPESPRSAAATAGPTPKFSLDDEGSGDPGFSQLHGSMHTSTSEEQRSAILKLDLKSPLANHIYVVFLILHLCYEVKRHN